jgi:hypothetical protein
LNKLRQHIADTAVCASASQKQVRDLSEAMPPDKSEHVDVGPLMSFIADGPLRNAILPTMMESLFAQLHELSLREDKPLENPSRDETILDTLKEQLQILATHLRTLSVTVAGHQDLESIDYQAVKEAADCCFSAMSSVRAAGTELGEHIPETDASADAVALE